LLAVNGRFIAVNETIIAVNGSLLAVNETTLGVNGRFIAANNTWIVVDERWNGISPPDREPSPGSCVMVEQRWTTP
jgi:hypothetical protein